MIILPTKHLPSDRSGILIGGEILALLMSGPLSADEIVRSVNRDRDVPESFDYLSVILAFLYAIGAVDIGGDLVKVCLPEVTSTAVDGRHADQ